MYPALVLPQIQVYESQYQGSTLIMIPYRALCGIVASHLFHDEWVSHAYSYSIPHSHLTKHE